MSKQGKGEKICNHPLYKGIIMDSPLLHWRKYIGNLFGSIRSSTYSFKKWSLNLPIFLSKIEAVSGCDMYAET